MSDEWYRGKVGYLLQEWKQAINPKNTAKQEINVSPQKYVSMLGVEVASFVML